MEAYLKNNLIHLKFDYNPAVLKFIRTLDGRGFDRASREWILPLAIGQHNLRNLEKLGFSVSQEVYDALKRDLSLAKNLERLEHRLDAPLATSLPLYPFQKAAVAWLVKAGGGICAYPVGVGKTLMSLATIDILGTTNNLIVCPKSLIYQWQSEINKWLPDFKVFVVDGNFQQRKQVYEQVKVCNEPYFLIMSYELARIDKDILMS